MQKEKTSCIALYEEKGNEAPFNWNLEVNGTTIFTSTSFVTEEGVHNCIDKTKQISSDRAKYIISENMFELHDDGVSLGESISYGSKEELNQAVNEFDEILKNSSVIVGKNKIKEEDHHKYTIYISGEEYDWNKKTISFEEAIILFFGSYDDRPEVSHTVGYKYKKTDGQYTSMNQGDVVEVKNKMRFEVDKTDRS